MTYEFLLTIDVKGSSEQHAFSVAASTLSSAVTRSLDWLARERPDARFKGLTYYAPPVTVVRLTPGYGDGRGGGRLIAIGASGG